MAPEETVKRAWCGVCGTYGYDQQTIPCMRGKDVTTRVSSSCGLMGRVDAEDVPVSVMQQAMHQEDAFQCLPEEATEVPELSRFAQRIQRAADQEATRKELLLRDAQARLAGKTLEGTPRRETVLTDEPRGPEGYPDGNPKTALGLKKPSFTAIPPVALIHLGRAMADGRRKYGLMNWREKGVTTSVYVDAALRHLLAWYDGEQIAEDSGVHHLGHVMACMAILIDAQATGQLNDDRPIPGPFGFTVKELTNAA